MKILADVQMYSKQMYRKCVSLFNMRTVKNCKKKKKRKKKDKMGIEWKDPSEEPHQSPYDKNKKFFILGLTFP